MDHQGETPVDGAGTPPATEERHVGPRLWALRVFVLALLLAGAATVATAGVMIVKESDGPADARTAQFGVVMPDGARYRAVVADLLARKQPRQLLGLTVKGSGGEVTVFHAKRKGATSFPSDYLNPGALSLIARSIGARSDTVIKVDELRLEKLRSTGRLRWRLRGQQQGRAWRATIAPNGTQLRLLPTKAT
jgi:hypothetical protein